MVTDRARFLDLLREKLGSKNLENSKIDDLLLLVSDLQPDYVAFKKDSLDLSFDEEGVYLQIPYSELGGLLNLELGIE